jgi:ribosomal protein S18 acetylase RimI-like enzyme
MREADAKEVMASSGHSPEEAIVYSFRVSQECYVAEIDYIPFAIFGLAQSPDWINVGIPWMLATDEITRYPTEVAKVSRRWVTRFSTKYEYLTNCVDVCNTLSIHWLKWCGFHEARVFPEYGKAKIPFVEMVKERDAKNQTSTIQE